MKPGLLLECKRDGLSEVEHYGYVLLVGKDGALGGVGDSSDVLFYQRSCAKPLQASLLFDLGVAERFFLTKEEIAICAASHVGEESHTRVVRQLLEKSKSNESELLCGLHSPLSDEAKSTPLSVLQNNCSGKHAMMLLICEAMGWNKPDYMNSEHPLQQAILKSIKSLCEIAENTEIPKTKDGCGTPIYATTLEALSKGYLNLFLNEKYSELRAAFSAYPYIIGGKDRLDSEIINATNGRLIAKVGAGGLIVIVNTEKHLALAIKIVDAGMKARALTAIESLLQLGWISALELESSPLLVLYDKDIKTLHGEKIGAVEPAFNIE